MLEQKERVIFMAILKRTHKTGKLEMQVTVKVLLFSPKMEAITAHTMRMK